MVLDMAEFYVERQYWAHWPKVLLMCRKCGNGIERRRYVHEKTCHPRRTVVYEGTPFQRWLYHCPNSDSDYAMDWTPSFCPECGGRLEVEDDA